VIANRITPDRWRQLAKANWYKTEKKVTQDCPVVSNPYTMFRSLLLTFSLGVAVRAQVETSKFAQVTVVTTVGRHTKY